MRAVTIPQKLAEKDDLVVIPRKEYESLLELGKVREFTPTSTQKRALAKAENRLRRGKTLSYRELAKKLGFRG